ncbi:MAG TPA: hypothetical protein PLS25_03895 [Methanoregulaceae archaeon]|nr:hypothetical protein [Methanoregulaceae archaeon]HOH80747.1 hypothetical protein [Methanoregulaceae archaeon]
MSGFIKIDVDDFFEFWSVQPPKLFVLHSFLLASAWRKANLPKISSEKHFRVTLWENQLILHIRQTALKLNLPESTLRDLLKKLEENEMIRIDYPVDGIKVITVMGVYVYSVLGERTPCTYHAPSVADLRTHRDGTEFDPSPDPDIYISCNDLVKRETGRLEDSRLKEVENHDKHVSEGTNEPKHVGVGDQLTANTSFPDDIMDLAVCLVEKDSSLTPEKAIKEAKRLLTEEDEVWDLD